MNFGGVSITKDCFELIKELLPEGKTILEFGSGYGTEQLGKHYTMYSVENQKEWQNAFLSSTTYINVGSKMYDETYPAPPIEGNKGWYDPTELFEQLPEQYDLILIDGPGGGNWGRAGFLKHIDKFNTTAIMIFDDLHRQPEIDLMKAVSEHVGRPYTILDGDKPIGYIL
jgi:hypothetical protein